MILDTTLSSMAGAYEPIAPEYYDSDRHPTCHNFRDASVRALHPWLRRYCTTDARLLEVGAGKSVLLEYVRQNGVRPSRLIVTDASVTMLSYSREIATIDDELVVAVAEHLPVNDSNLTCLVASLGDPYNYTGFWREAWRVLRPEGRALFTTPSHEWAKAFRVGSNESLAEFEIAVGQKIAVPSVVLEVDQQIDLMRSVGFRTLAVQEIAIDEIDTARISRKLILSRHEYAPIVRAYLVRKQV